MSDDVRVRCSSLDRIIACPASLRECAGMASITSPEANAGTAWHKVAELLLQDARFSVRTVASMHGVKESEIVAAVDALTPYVDPMRDKDAQIEMRLNSPICKGAVLSGKMDWHLVRNGEARIVDWKTFFAPLPDELHTTFQAWGYAILVAENWSVNAVEVEFINPRLKQRRSMRVDAGEIAHVKSMLASHISEAIKPGMSYKVGHHCERCNARVGGKCPAHRLEVIDIARNLPQTLDLCELAPSEVAEVYRKATLLANVCGDIKDRVKALVKERGPVDLGDGRELSAKSKTSRKIATTADSWAKLLMLLGPSIADVIGDISYAAVEAQYLLRREQAEGYDKDRPPRGWKKMQTDSLFTALDTIGAIKTIEYPEVRERKTKE